MTNQRQIAALSRAIQIASTTRQTARSSSYSPCISLPSNTNTVVRQRHHCTSTTITNIHRPHPSLSSVTPPPPIQTPRRIQTRSNFSYAGPRKLSDVLKIDQIANKTKVEVSDLWMTYHENKEKVHGLVLDGGVGKSVLGRAAQCPFFIHPVFREEGHFMILSQFQPPNHFLLAFLEDYKMDPSRAQPLLTLSIFDDLADSHDLALVRCDVINNGIEEDEGYKLAKCLIGDYGEEEKFGVVHLFNKMPEKFDVEEFVRGREDSWKSDGGGRVEDV